MKKESMTVEQKATSVTELLRDPGSQVTAHSLPSHLGEAGTGDSHQLLLGRPRLGGAIPRYMATARQARQLPKEEALP